jgi:hypothetical protein
MECMFINYGLLQVFGYSFESLLCYKNYASNSYNVIILYIYHYNVDSFFILVDYV